MARQFKRKYLLQFVGETETREFKDLRISFEVVKSSRSFANLLVLEVFNLSSESIGWIQSNDPLVILQAGYENSIGLIFKGRISNVFPVRASEDKILTVYAADGRRDMEKAIYNKTLAENVDIKTAVTSISQTIIDQSKGDIVRGIFEGLDDIPADKLRGQSLSGQSKEILDVLAEDYNFKWYISDGELIVKELYDSPISALEDVIIKQTTGMIGSPTVTYEGADVTSLLNPELRPDRAFQIESESASLSVGDLRFRRINRTVGTGRYRAFEVVHTGDTHTDAWYTITRGATIPDDRIN